VATIIDSLFVELGLDAAKFKKGAKETDAALDKTSGRASKTSKDMEAWGKNAAASMSKLRNEVLGLLAVFTAGVGIKSFVSNTIDSTASLGRMSANLNMSAKDLAEWQLANKNAGGSVEGMTSQLKEASNSVAAFKNGFMNDGTRMAFFYGLKQDDLKNGNTYLLARAKIVSDLYKQDPTKAQFVASQMGISEDTFSLIKQGPEAIGRLREAQSALAEEQAKASIPAEKLRQKIDSLKNRFEAIGVKILTGLMPQLDRFTDWLNANQGNIKAWADKAVAAIEKFVKWADSAAQSVGGWKTVLLALLGLKIISMVAPLISLAAALAGVGTSLGLIGAAGAALKVLGPLALMFHSEGLNKGEAEELARRKAAPTGTAGNSLNDRQKYLVSRLKTDGYSDAQAAGIVGSLMQESGLDPNAVNKTSGATGIAQWLGPRKKQFAKSYGHDLSKSTFEEQTDFMLWELRNTEKRSGDLLRRAGSAQLAAQIHAQEYERPGAAEANIAKRQANAMAVVNMLPMTRPQQVAGNTSTSTSETVINGPININTQATDAAGIARDFGKSVKDVAFASQANTGMQ
jgi:hypothetical protein